MTADIILLILYVFLALFFSFLCSIAEAVLLNQHQHTNPIGMTPSPEGAVTIVDPRHPLFNQTFPLIEITDHLAIGRCCRIWLPCEAERLIPLAVTDRAPRQPIIFPLSIDATSLQQLLQTYKRITSQQMEVGQDEVEKRKGGGGVVTAVDSSEPGGRGESAGARADMVVAKQAATTGSLSNASAGVPASGTKRLPGGGR